MTTLTAGRPWRDDASTIGLVGVAHGVSHFCQLIVPPLFPWLARDFALSNTQLGALMSVFFAVSCVGQALAGFVVDRFGAMKVLFASLGLLMVAAIGLAASPGYGTLMLFMAVAGLGNCAFHPVDYSILNARVSAPRLGHAYAAHGISGALGWALAPLFVVGLTGATGNWRIALAAVAGVVAAVLVLLWLRKDGLAVQAPRGIGGAASAGGGFAFLRSRAVWVCFVFFLVFAVILGGVQSFAPAAAARLHGLDVAQVALCLSAYMVASSVGMVVGGQLLTDPARCVRIAAAAFGVAASLALAIGLLSWPAAWVPVLVGAMGFSAGIAGPSRDLLVKQATPPGATGRVYGVVFSGLDVGMVLAPLAFGALMDAGRPQAVWVGIAAMQALLIGTAVNVRRNTTRPQPLPA